MNFTARVRESWAKIETFRSQNQINPVRTTMAVTIPGTFEGRGHVPPTSMTNSHRKLWTVARYSASSPGIEGSARLRSELNELNNILNTLNTIKFRKFHFSTFSKFARSSTFSTNFDIYKLFLNISVKFHKNSSASGRKIALKKGEILNEKVVKRYY